MTDVSSDWIDDGNMSSEETLARFDELGPTRTRGPLLPAGAVILVAADSFGPGAIRFQAGSVMPFTVTSGSSSRTDSDASTA